MACNSLNLEGCLYIGAKACILVFPTYVGRFEAAAAALVSHARYHQCAQLVGGEVAAVTDIAAFSSYILNVLPQNAKVRTLPSGYMTGKDRTD